MAKKEILFCPGLVSNTNFVFADKVIFYNLRICFSGIRLSFVDIFIHPRSMFIVDPHKSVRGNKHKTKANLTVPSFRRTC